MKQFSLLLIAFAIPLCLSGQGNNLDKGQPDYVPSPENLKNREWFRDAHFGMFVHWGLASLHGEEIGWLLSGKDVKAYHESMYRFNPAGFDANALVKLARDAGMKYITFTTRHHDSFSMFDTRYSDFGIMHTPYAKDILKQLAEACQKEGIRLFCYYSLTDFYRPDYCQGGVQKGTGIEGTCDWDAYIQFMKNQLSEILTNYGPIYGIWFDGHWDQVAYKNGRAKNQLRCWHYDEIYKLIHDLQPGCMIVNNHHLAPFPGEDYQTFERDMPGENAGGGFSADAAISNDLPLETSDIIGRSWGYVNNDTVNRSAKELVHMLVKSAGLGANLLLNTGPTMDGNIRPEHQARLLAMGDWLKIYGETIYGTRKSFMKPADWGVAVEKGNRVYLHILKREALGKNLHLKNFPWVLVKCSAFETGEVLRFERDAAGGINIDVLPAVAGAFDQVVVLEVDRTGK